MRGRSINLVGIVGETRNSGDARLILLGRMRKGDEGDNGGGVFNFVRVGATLRPASGLFVNVGESDNLHHYFATVRPAVLPVGQARMHEGRGCHRRPPFILLGAVRVS